MRRSRIRLAYIALVILAVLGGYLGTDFLRSSDSPSPDTEQKLVYFQLPTSRGGQWSSSPVPAKVVLVNFWATWCLPCRSEIPLLIAAQTQHNLGLQVVGIAIDDEAPVRRFEDEVGMNYISLVSRIGGTELMRRYGNPGHLPLTLVFSPEGILLHRKTGEISATDLDHWLGSHFLKQ